MAHGVVLVIAAQSGVHSFCYLRNSCYRTRAAPLHLPGTNTDELENISITVRGRVPNDLDKKMHVLRTEPGCATKASP